MSCSRILFGLLSAALATVISGCLGSGTPARIYPPSINASAAGAKAMEMYDANKDGKLSDEELDKCPALKDSAKKANAEITADFIANRIKEWQATRIGQTQFGCTIKHHGKPLVGADVIFIPEKFLGDNIKPASGKTMDGGGVSPVISADAPGLALGWYRVVVSKPGLNIPPKYSSETETVLGVEVGNDIGGAASPVFDMKF